MGSLTNLASLRGRLDPGGYWAGLMIALLCICPRAPSLSWLSHSDFALSRLIVTLIALLPALGWLYGRRAKDFGLSSRYGWLSALVVFGMGPVIRLIPQTLIDCCQPIAPSFNLKYYWLTWLALASLTTLAFGLIPGQSGTNRYGLRKVDAERQKDGFGKTFD